MSFCWIHLVSEYWTQPTAVCLVRSVVNMFLFDDYYYKMDRFADRQQ